jgi:hypothetical protein
MQTFKTVLLFMLGGALAGAVIATLLAPSFLVWYNTPGEGLVQSICNYPQMVRQTVRDMIRAQLIGVAAGAALGLGVGILVRVRARRKVSSPLDAGPKAPAV